MVAWRLVASHECVEEPRAVQMHGNVVLLADSPDALDLTQVPAASSAFVDGVLDGHETRPRKVGIVAPVDVLADLRGGKPPVLALQQAHRGAGVRRYAAALVQIDVRQLVADHLIPGLRMDLDADLIGHRARRTEQRGLLAKQIRGLPLQLVDGLVLTEYVVTDLRLQHRFQHRRGRSGDGIASYVDHLWHESSPARRLISNCGAAVCA